jgi:hypothetical protein
MQFSATFRHIDKDFGFEALELGRWSEDYEDEESFILALNRMAIASSQQSVFDFPEVEVRAKLRRVTIRAIDGQLYYSDFNSQHQKDLKVVPDEVVSLLGGTPIEGVFQAQESEPTTYVPPQLKPYRNERNRYITVGALILMLVVLGICSQFIWHDVSQPARLHTAPQFIPSLSEESEVLRKYADVYVSEYREGAMLFELTREGQLSRYEMWHSKQRNGFVLVRVDSSPLQVGRHNGELAMLAGEIYLLVPQGDEMLSLLGVHYRRHHGALTSIGELLDVKR